MSSSNRDSSQEIVQRQFHQEYSDVDDDDDDDNFDHHPFQFVEIEKQNHQYKKYTQMQASLLEDKIDEFQFLEDKEQKEQLIDTDAKLMEALENIHLNILPRSDVVHLSQFPQQMPLIISIKAIKSQQKKTRAPIDLVCVVDVSGSMQGKKIRLVMDSLRYIQKILSPNDRLSIITFDTCAQINLPWTRNLPENKPKIKAAIIGMKIRDSTNIADGVKLGLKMIKDRKYKNSVTCMFVLTDGQDDKKGADSRVAQVIAEYGIKDTFVINSFGYGDDHDAKVMNNIANLKGGTFTFIENIEKASEHFILAMSGMLSIVAKNVKLVVQENPTFKISKIFGDDFLWKQVDQGKYEMNLNFQQDHDNKEFALVLELPTNDKINLKQEIVLKAHLQGDLIELKTDFVKNAELILNFSLQEVQYELKEIVEVNYLRAKSGDIIGQAKELAKKKKYDQAQQLLNQMIDEIEESQFQKVKQLEIVLKDLNQVKEICKPAIFEQNGEALMLNKQKNHIQRQHSLNNSMEWNSDQEEQMENYKNGMLELSECDMDDSYQDVASSDDPIQQNSNKSDVSDDSI